MYSLHGTTLDEDQRSLLSSTFLLDYMERNQRSFDVLLADGEAELEPILHKLMVRECVALDKKHHYSLTAKGRKKAQEFAARYQALLTYFDVFAHVDLEEGEFALANYFEHHSDTSWLEYLDNERWEDLRLPIAKMLGADPLELVFAHFVREARLDTDNNHWALDILAGSAWTELEEICQSAITADELSYEDEDGELISGETVLRDIAEQGFNVLREHHSNDQEVHSNLQAWYPQHGSIDTELPRPKAGWERPIWQTPWTLDL